MTRIEKWLITYENGSLLIIPKKISWHAPLNRVSDKIGYYLIDFIEIKEIIYAITFDQTKSIGNISKMLITKFVETNNGSTMTNLDESDKENITIIVNRFIFEIKKDSFNKTIN